MANKTVSSQNETISISAGVENSEHTTDEQHIGHLAAIVESSDDAIISKSLDGLVKSWNKGAEKMFGYTAKEIIGKHISIIIPKDFIDEERKILERICNNEIIAHFETIRLKKNGTRFNVSLTVSPLKDRAGVIIGVSKIARDITSQKISEAALMQANDKLVFQNEEKGKRAAELVIANEELAFQNGEKEKRAAELLIANRELVFQNKEKEKRASELIIANKELAFQNDEKEKRAAELITANKELVFQNEEKEKRAAELVIANKELEQLTYIASHDLQEPLRTIANYMQVFEEDYSKQLDENAYRYIRSINAASNRMGILVQGLLGFSRLGRHKHLVRVDCNTILDNVIADLQTVIKSSHANIKIGEMPTVNAYALEMGQLFQNLITNAIKFQKQGICPQIQITADRVNEMWQFAVRDNGIGIEPIYFQRIFDIFQRLHSNEEYQGYGIGLANCKKIVELHHGEIWIESIVGKGSTVYFTIPNLLL